MSLFQATTDTLLYVPIQDVYIGKYSLPLAALGSMLIFADSCRSLSVFLV